MLKGVFLLLASGFCVPLLSQQTLANGKPDFNGKWELKMENERSGNSSALVIEQSEEEVHIRDTGAAQDMQTNFKCGTRGAECKARIDGRDAKVTLWYNGPALVEMETIGSDVTKKRLTLSPDGKTLTMEVLRIVPTGKDPEKRIFSRVVTSEQAETRTP